MCQCCDAADRMPGGAGCLDAPTNGDALTDGDRPAVGGSGAGSAGKVVTDHTALLTDWSWV